MILVTVGTQLPFDRLMRLVDELAPSLDMPVFAQTGLSTYRPVNVDWSPTLLPGHFNAKFRAASIIVAHAGIGTILTAQRLNKPIILFPREARLGEHRNDHQLATCKKLGDRRGIYVARTGEELTALLVQEDLVPADGNESIAGRARFVDNISDYLGRLAATK